jgi:signal transduction histidine kinase
MSGAQPAALPTQAAGRLAWTCAAVSGLLAAAALGIAVRGAVASGDYRAVLSHQTVTPFLTAAFAFIGALVAARRPANPIGWIFVTAGLLYALTALAAALTVFQDSAPAVYRWAAWFSGWLWLPAVFLPATFVLLIFPDGRLPSPRWGVVGWSAAAGMALTVLAVMLHPGPLAVMALPANPFGVLGTASLFDGLLTIGGVLLGVGFLGSLAGLFSRFRRSTAVQREQIKWLVYAVGINLLAYLVSTAAGFIWPESPWKTEISIVASDVSILAIAVAAAIAILRYRLYDINLVINRTLVYGALTAAVAVLYMLVVGGLGVLLQGRGSLALSLLGVGIVAVVAQPLRNRLQRAANRLMYGDRDDPYAVLSRVSHQFEAVSAPGDMLPSLAETIAQTLKLPYVAIAVQKSDTGPAALAAYGRPAPVAVRLPLNYQSACVGELLVAERAPAEPFTPAEQRLLGDIARQAGVAVHAATLTAALQQSRERLVNTREEERRRIRRDLHDGLGPTLASHSYRLDAALDLMDHDPAAARRLIADLKDQTQSTLADIRRLVYQLRPPALDELGLVAALQGLFAEVPDGLQVRVEASPETLPPLSAAVEVAAYRIAAEAVTNAARHAQAQHCRVRLTAAAAELTVEVSDDGRGLRNGARSGVGLASMRERAAELGGLCTVQPRAGGGTRVHARLPLHPPPEA